MAGSSFDLGGDYGVAVYSKPALALTTLQRTLGDETMRAIMNTYTTRFQFKHPTAADFRTVAEEVSGKDLEWFFAGLVESKDVVNYAITGLTDSTGTVDRLLV